MRQMSISFHIDFNGRCQEAFEFYAARLQGDIASMLQVKDSPLSQSYSDDWQHKIVHAHIKIQGVEIAGADVKPEHYQKPQGFYVLLGLGTEDSVQSVFKQLCIEGEVVFPPQKTFWSPCYSIVIDRFGVPWKINCRI